MSSSASKRPAVGTGPLFQPGQIGTLALGNRIVLAPMTRVSAREDGRPSPKMAAHYARYARGGFGLLIGEGTYTDERHSQCYRNQPGFATDAQAEAWVPVVDAVHAEGARIFAQLMHGGALCLHNRYTEERIAPSAVQPIGEQPTRYYGSGPYPIPREMTPAEIETVIAGFAAAARRAVQAGMDGVEIHGANGYLIDNFLTAYANHRTDAYGGRVENRIRFAVEVTQAVVATVPRGFPVGIRISQTKVNDLDYSWPGAEADAKAIFGVLGQTGAAYIHVSSHLGCGPVFGSSRSLAGMARLYGGITVIANGKLHDTAMAERLIEGGEADFVSVAKAALADPAWPRRIAAGETPIPFDPAIFSPNATYEVEAAWRERLNPS